MTIDRAYFIHTRAGLLGAPPLSSLADVDAIAAALQKEAARHLIVHFHGGLVPAVAGMSIAERLYPLYRAAGHPVFFVWESGAWETIRNNIAELADEPVFKQLLRKALEYALGKLGARSGARSIRPSQVSRQEVAETIARFIANPRPDTIPYSDFVPSASDAQRRSAADALDEGEIQADLETDDDFRRALATLPDIPAGRRSALAPGGDATERRTAFATLASEMLSERPGARGIVTLLKAALVLKDIVVGVLGRYSSGRDHGFYATCVEELVRAFKVFGSGVNEWAKALQWNRMKKDCSDAFGDDEACAGRALLVRLRDLIAPAGTIDRITLVGHSTGAVAIAEWLEAGDGIFDPSIRFDLVFLAPAVSYERFARTLKGHAGRIRNFRMFAMTDDLERADQVWGKDPALRDARDWRRFIYPSSLLYLVSGLLESKPRSGVDPVDEPDMPLLGMQRFFASTSTYDEQRFPEVQAVRGWLSRDPKRTVWSVVRDAGPGLNSESKDHGFFDDDPATLESLRSIVMSGFDGAR